MARVARVEAFAPCDLSMTKRSWLVRLTWIFGGSRVWLVKLGRLLSAFVSKQLDGARGQGVPRLALTEFANYRHRTCCVGPTEFALPAMPFMISDRRLAQGCP